jgi:hypothetical protein
MPANTQTITETAINTKLLKDIASFLNKQVSEHRAVIGELEEEIIKLAEKCSKPGTCGEYIHLDEMIEPAENCSEPETWGKNLHQVIANITQSFNRGYCADIQTNHRPNEQTTKLDNDELKSFIEKAREACIRNIEKAGEDGIKNIETIINYLLAQEIFKEAVVTEVTDDPILAELDIPGTRDKPKFYKISTHDNHYSLLIGCKNGELLIERNQRSDRLEAMLNELPELRNMLDLVAKTKIWQETNTPIKAYSVCHRLTIPHAKEVAIYRIKTNTTNPNQKRIDETIFQPTLINSKSNEMVIEVNQQINTLKQTEPNSILLVLESLYIPEGLNTDIEIEIIHNKKTQKLEIRSVGENNKEQNEEQIARVNITCMEVEHKIGEDWISPKGIVKEIESMLKSGAKHISNKQTKVGASIREAIGSIFTEKSQEVIHVNLLDSENPVRKVLSLDLEGHPKADKTRLRTRRSCQVPLA